MNFSKKRDPALDMIRCLALFCVISVHFFLNTGFYDSLISGNAMLIMTILRNSFMICVPLFMTLTGYLVQSKEPNKLYYIKLVRIIYVYIAASVLCGLYRILYLNDGLSFLGAIINIFSFDTAPYSWYIEMYIGFFLLIPFLNIMYEGLCTQKKKKILIVSLLLLTALPSMMNIYCIAGLDWWLMPSKASNYFPLVPDWWSNIYPLTYFFIGKYLREYPPQLNRKHIVFLIFLVFLGAGLFNFYRSYGSLFIWGQWQDYGSFLITLQTILIFCFFLKINYENLPPIFCKLIARVSDLSLGAYLTSWIFDQIVYAKLNDSVPLFQQKIIWFPVAVALVLIGSVLCSLLVDIPYSYIIKKYINRYIVKVSNNQSNSH